MLGTYTRIGSHQERSTKAPLKFVHEQTETKLRGGYYTPNEIATFLSRWVLDGSVRTVLEPSCGDGAFFGAMARLRQAGLLPTVVGIEIDPLEAAKASSLLAEAGFSDSTVYTGDFIAWSLQALAESKVFDGAVGNPPYIRYQYVDRRQQILAQQLMQCLGLKSTGHINAWVPFVAASIRMLAPGGRMAMLVPSELLHIPHAQSLRDMLMDECLRTLVIDPAGLWVEDILQGVVLILTEKKGCQSQRGMGLWIQDRAQLSDLMKPPESFFESAREVGLQSRGKKWMTAFLSRSEASLLHDVAARPGVATFKDLADVDVGIVTGANKFFLVPREVVEQYGLHPWSHPMFGRSSHVQGVVMTEEAIAINGAAGLPNSFLWFDKRPREEYPNSVQAYFAKGEAEGLHQRYKCRIRTPWYVVPSVYASPVSVLKRCHDFPRAIWNQAKALTTDTAYRVMPKTMDSQVLVGAFVNGLTALSAELEGRHYGGGVLELVPSEIERLLIPVCPAPDAVYDLDVATRQKAATVTIIEQQDRRTLNLSGISTSEADVLRGAWLRLRNRRQRVTDNPTEARDGVMDAQLPFVSRQ